MSRLKKVFILFIFVLAISFQLKATGIIIADEEKQTRLFNSTEEVVLRFADTIISHYDSVVIHLGRRYVFRRGNIFTTERSRENLAMFSTYLQAHNVKIYYWFFDSFGGDRFDNIYKEYKEMIDENMKEIDRIFPTYDGIFVDLEWINRKGYNNNNHFIQIIKYLREKIDKKEIYFFASLLDNEKSNRNRGYDMIELKKYNALPVTMLYINDGGYYLDRKNVYPELDDDRIKKLSNYYRKKDYKVAVSLTDCWLIKKGKEVVSVTLSDEDVRDIESNLFLVKQIPYKYFTMKYYLTKKELNVTISKSEKYSLGKNQPVYFSEINRDIVKHYNFVWEYFNINMNTDFREK